VKDQHHRLPRVPSVEVGARHESGFVRFRYLSETWNLHLRNVSHVKNAIVQERTIGQFSRLCWAQLCDKDLGDVLVVERHRVLGTRAN
jgi:hypothetical protein